MDTSKEYIQMCDCKEIQGLRKSLDGDFIYDLIEEKVIVKSQWQGSPINSTWLPRQDQLQEMIEGFIKPKETLVQRTLKGWFHEMSRWGEEEYMYTLQFRDSGEQLWLAFVMKEKFNLTWKDGKWENIK